MNVWLPFFACPECRGAATDGGDGGFSCVRCRNRFERRGGIYRFLTPRREEAALPFVRQYRQVRERDGYRASAPEYYRMLPIVPHDDPHAAEWRLRRESYAHLLRHALPAIWLGSARVLDLGAGCGWLSHRLASFGHRVVAVDRLDDEADGLGVARHYPVPFAAVQADFDALPFEPWQFDVAVFEGSLHYSPDPQATLAEARRMIAPGGVIAVMDSPMFTREADGHAMVEQQHTRMQSEYGVAEVVRTGVGFLTFVRIEQAARSLGLQGRFFRSHGPLAWRLRRQFARLRLGRAPAAFGVWVAR
jgi:SAM-dependent methyltransferase